MERKERQKAYPIFILPTPSEEDLASEVRSKLEANIPRGKLTVTAKNAEITVSEVVKTRNELDKIKPLAMEIKGVHSVMVKAVMKP